MELVKGLFSTNKIKYIVSVDDCYGEDTKDVVADSEIIDEMVSDIKPFVGAIGQIGEGFDVLKLNVLPEELRRKMISDWIDHISSSEKEKLKKVMDVDSSALVKQKDSLEGFLLELKKTDVITDYKTFPSIQTAKNFLTKIVKELWNPSQNIKVLWLIDRDFGKPGTGEDGFKLLQEFNYDESQGNIGILATNKIDDIEKEEQFNNFLDGFSNLSNNKNLVWKINKEYIDKKTINEFVHEIKYGLKRNYTYKITNFLTETLKNGMDLAGSKFKNIEQSTFNNIVMNFSISEGVSIIDTLTRVFLVITKHDLNENISKKLNDLTKMIRDYEELCFFSDDDEYKNLNEVHDIRHREKYNNWVNEHHYPVSFGDIFSINEMEYVLISQPCDITIRGKGSRKIKTGLLLKITNEKPVHDNYVELNYYKKGTTQFVILNDEAQVDLDLLDLCSINNNGQSKITIADLLNENLVEDYKYPQGLRVNLKGVICRIKDIYNRRQLLIKSLNELLDGVTQSATNSGEIDFGKMFDEYKVKELEYWDNIIAINNFLQDGTYLFYNIHRICRLDESMTTKISFEHFTLNSRIGVPGDYANNYKLKKYAITVENPAVFFLGKDALEPIPFEKELFIRFNDSNKEAILLDRIASAVQEVAPTVDITLIKQKITGDNTILLHSGFLPIKVKDKTLSCIINNGILKIPNILFLQECSKFMELISNCSETLSQIREIKKFYKNDKSGNYTINEYISIKETEFEEGLMTISVNDKIILTISASIIHIEGFSFELNINFLENTEEISMLLQQS